MSGTETWMKGVYLLEVKQHTDHRGSLRKPFSYLTLPEPLQKPIREVWFTQSKQNVIRGMHFQTAPYACEKFVSILSGTVQDVLLDLREDSDTYGSFLEVLLTEESPCGIWIPAGVAHGYRVLSEESRVMYLGTEVNVPSCDLGIRWDSFGYAWGIANPILSEKDSRLPPFQSIKQ